MPQTQTLEIIIRLRDLASRNIRKLGKAVGGMRTGVRAASSAVFSLQSAFLSLGVGLLAHSFLDVASSFEQMEIKLDALTKGKGRDTLEEINEWAKRMPVDTRKAVDTFAMMQALGLDPTIDKMQTLVDVSVLFGEDTMPRVARALGQMQTLGRLSSEELNQLAEAGINARGILRDAFGGKTVEEIQKSGIEITKITDAIWAGLRGEYAGAAEKAQDTWSGLMITIKSEWVDAQKLIMDAGLFDFLKANLQELLGFFDKMTEAELDVFFEKTAKSIIGFLKGVATVIAGVGDAWRGWKLIWYGLQVVYGNFSVWLNDQLLTLAKVVDLFLTDAEKGILKIAKVVELLGKIAGVDLGFADALNSLKGMSSKMDGFIESSEEAKKFWIDIVKEAEKNLEVTAKEETLLSRVDKVMASIEKRAEAIRTKREDAGVLQKMGEAWEAFSTDVKVEVKVEPVKVASPQALAAKALSDLKALSETQSQFIESQFAKQKITVAEYYAERLRMTEELYNAELALLQQKEKQEKKLDKKTALNAQIFALEKSHQRDLFSLSEQKVKLEDEARKEALQKEIDFAELKQRELAAESTEAGIASQFTMELLAMDQKHAEELSRIGTHEKDKALLEETYRVQKLEKERLLADQQIRLQEMILDAASTVTGDVASAFKALYEVAGKNAKTFFKVYKAAAIAQAIIDTYQGATAAYKAMAGIPYVGPALGVAAAIAAIAAGMARVATIRQQDMAKGGEVEGRSPHREADNIPIMATAGEYMQPVDTVRHYGTSVMEAIREKVVPIELLKKYTKTVSRVAVTRARALADGGPILGFSPTPTADNIPIMATAGEYVHPVTAVKYYGRNVMNAIRQKLIPRDVLANFSVPDIINTTKQNFQTGGAVTASAARQATAGAVPAQAGAAEDRINITNVTDPNLMGQFLASKPGEQQILNIISENSHNVKTSLFAREG